MGPLSVSKVVVKPFATFVTDRKRSAFPGPFLILLEVPNG